MIQIDMHKNSIYNGVSASLLLNIFGDHFARNGERKTRKKCDEKVEPLTLKAIPSFVEFLHF